MTVVFSALSTNKWQFLAARTITGVCIGANFGAIVSFASEVCIAVTGNLSLI